MSDTAVYERCERNLNEGNSPPCITARRGGCVIKQCRAATEETQPGWFSSLFSAGKPPRPRVQRRLRDILVIARPPLLAVMQGGELPWPQLLFDWLEPRFLECSLRLWGFELFQKGARDIGIRCSGRDRDRVVGWKLNAVGQ